eukprot:CAMPEP_0174245960 /NCGR_PEP_ID=MMETSP0417-20130205/41506_1 /TAXON_ID=242541 /ORGANISM="Mayorella sp, Strain BSH-02190019" /LENGTH=329 /DNA_ID=CAMNT_0015325795 /DNA_START=30 /DNA_END=1015 /DNA_ORIENTATION=-
MADEEPTQVSPKMTFEGNGASITNVFLTPNWLYCGSNEDGTLRSFRVGKKDAKSESKSYDLQLKGLYHHSSALVVLRADHKVSMWSLGEKRVRATLSGHQKWITSVLVTESGALLTASADNTVCLWEVDGALSGDGGPNGGRQSTIKPALTFKGHTDTITAMVFCRQDLFTSSADKTLRRWTLGGKCIEEIKGHENWVLALHSYDDKMLVSTSRDQTMRLWTVASRKKFGGRKNTKCHKVVELPGLPHFLKVYRTAAYVATSDNNITSYEIKTGKKLQVFEGHTGKVRSLVFVNYAMWSASADRAIRKWNTTNGKCCSLYAGHSKAVNS